MILSDDFQEWQPDEWFDRGFLQSVPLTARPDFLKCFRPVNISLSNQIQQSLFAGVKDPFNYLRATGWMGTLYRQPFTLLPTASFEVRADHLSTRLGWMMKDLVLLVYHQPTTYATAWGDFLKYFRRGMINLDTMLVCHPKAREIVLFWEEIGPKLGKRGHRKLPCPSWVVASGQGIER